MRMRAFTALALTVPLAVAISAQQPQFVDEFGGQQAPVGFGPPPGQQQQQALAPQGFGPPPGQAQQGGFAGPSQTFFTEAPTQGGFTETQVNTINVVRGAWIRDAVDGSLLAVPEMTRVPESQRENYFNDGTHGDVDPGDEIYTNVEVLNSDFIGPVSQSYVLRYINMMRLLFQMDPLSFAAVKVASPDPVSPLPLLDDYAAHQQNRISGWNEKFLNPFRKPEVTGTVSPRGDFYPVFVPPPPYYRPVRPSTVNVVTPPLPFLQEAWVLYNGGTPNTQRLTYLNEQQQQGGGVYGPEGFEGGGTGAAEEAALYGGSSGRQYQGRSSYIDTGPPLR